MDAGAQRTLATPSSCEESTAPEGSWSEWQAPSDLDPVIVCKRDFRLQRRCYVRRLCMHHKRQRAGACRGTPVKLVVGHERGDLSGYSKGERVDLHAAIEKLKYGPEV
jgi:hypothetical protein